MKIFLLFIVIILLAGFGYGSWLYVQKNYELEQTRTTLAGLNATLVSLQGQIADEQANTAAVQGQLVNERARAAILEAELSTAINSSNSQKAALQSEVDTSKSKITKLETDLASANSLLSGAQSQIAIELDRLNTEIASLNTEIARLNSDLGKANSDLANLKATSTTHLSEIRGELNKVIDPRHFFSVEELQDWLQHDDTNTNPAYASLGLADKAFILQVKALRDGYLLPAAVDADTQHIYSWNTAIIGAGIYVVTASTDEILFLANFETPPAQRPLPLP